MFVEILSSGFGGVVVVITSVAEVVPNVVVAVIMADGSSDEIVSSVSREIVVVISFRVEAVPTVVLVVVVMDGSFVEAVSSVHGGIDLVISTIGEVVSTLYVVVDIVAVEDGPVGTVVLSELKPTKLGVMSSRISNEEDVD